MPHNLLRRKSARASVIGVTFIFLASCASHRAAWRTLPEFSVPYDRVWTVMLEEVALFYDRLTVADKEAGRIQTDWKEEKVGLIFGTPLVRTRLLAEVRRKTTPVAVDFKVERQEFSLDLGRWVNRGRQSALEDQVAQDLTAKLQRF